MNFRKHCSLLLATLFFSIYAYAQGGSATIKGVIQGNDKKKLSDIPVALLNSTNNMIGGALSEEDGTFEIQGVSTGSYTLKFSGLGFEEKIVPKITVPEGGGTIEVGIISLARSATSLKAVEIVQEKNMMEMHVDKKVFNVDKNITATGGTAADVLQNVPSVTVDPSGDVSLRGKSNVTILIDGRPATLLAGDVASALQALPAGSVESVEVISNPSAKYDAHGSTGIINIITKTNKRQGLNGTVNAGVGTRGKYNAGVNLGLKTEKWNFAFNSNFRISDNNNRSNTDRRNFLNDSGSYTTSDYQRSRNGWFNSITAGYNIDSQNTISLTQNFNIMRFGSEGSQLFNLYDMPGSYFSRQQRDEVFKGGPNSTSSNLNWKHKFKKPKQELTVDGTYSFSKSENSQTLNTQYLDPNNQPYPGITYQDIPSSNKNNNFNLQADFTTPFLTKEGKLEAGLKTQNFWFNSSNTPMITYPGAAPVEDVILKNQYKYEQNTHAGYVSFNDRYNKWSYQGGLRLEYAGYSGYAGNNTTTKYSNHFLNLFPSLYLAYQIKESQQIFLNYSKRINRPFFLRMMPYLNVSNALDTTSGNPNLKPEFINNIELAYNIQLPKGHMIMTSVYYQNTNNMVQTFTRPYADGTSFSQPINLNSASTYGLELIGKVQIMKSWDATLSVNMFQNQINGQNVDPSLNNDGFSWFSKLNSNYKVSKRVGLQLMGNYESSKPIAQGKRLEAYWLDFAVKANFLKGDKGTLTLNISDIFNTREYTTVYNLPLYAQTMYRKRESQIVMLTFSYKFGNTEWGAEGGKGRSKRGGRGTKSDKKELQDREDNIRHSDDDGQAGG